MSHGDEIKRIFDDPLRFSIDSGIEVVGIPDSVARLLKNVDVTFAALYSGGVVDADESRDGGILAGTPFGGAVTDGLGNLDLRGGTVKYVDYSPLLNVDQVLQTGTIRIEGFTPDYDTAPPTLQEIYVSENIPNTANRLRIAHETNGDLTVEVHSQSGLTIAAASVAGYVAQKDVPVEIELNTDSSAGVHRLFVAGAQLGGVLGGTGSRNNNVDMLRIGSDSGGIETADFKLSAVAVFDTVQHTANYTPGLAGLLFSKENPTIKSASTTLVKQVLSFRAEKAVDNPLSLDAIAHLFEIDGQPKWFDGGAWADSDQTTAASRLAESNTEAEMNDNVASLPLNVLGSLLRVINVVHSEDGLTSPTLATTTVGVSFDVADEVPPPECIVTGIEQDAEGNRLEGVLIAVEQEGFFHGAFHQPPRKFEKLSGPDGKWKIQLVETATLGLSPDREPYTFRINADRFTKIQIPNLANELFGNIRALPD